MACENFERCLAHTLKWEGNYSNHPDDPGGATMKGVTQATYNGWRKSQRKSNRSVRALTEVELRAIYRKNYWDACGCDDLASGLGFCVFDAAVNSGPARAKAWLEQADNIDNFTARRLAFVRSLRTWRTFGRGWGRRIEGVRIEAHRLAGADMPEPKEDDTLHAGVRGGAVRRLQIRLRALGYPCGSIDGIYGQQTKRAVVLFQLDQDDIGEHDGIWRPGYWAALDTAEPMLPKRKAATHRDLEKQGDKPVARMNFIQRIFAWIFGASAVAQVTDSSSVVESLGAAKTALEPASGLLAWASSNKFMLIAAGCVALIMLIRSLRAKHVQAYQHFDYQGEFKAEPAKEAA